VLLAHLEAAVELAGEVQSRSAEIEDARRLPDDIVERLVDCGLFRLAVPADLGGPEADARTIVEVIETLSRADGSVGWCVMIGTLTGLLASLLPDEGAKEIYGDPAAVTGGTFASLGRAEPVDGGWRVTGRWPFASGCEHSTWLMGGCAAEGDYLAVMMPAADVEVIDTWHVAGLRGTGSHDIAVRDAFVPDTRVVRMLDLQARRGGALASFPFFGLLALGVAAVGLGIARRSIDELHTLATGGGRRSAERPAVQATMARAEADLRAARALLVSEVDAAWSAAVAGHAPDIETRTALRLAATHAAHTAAEVTSATYDAGGAVGLYDSSALQRCFRDAHAVTMHVLVGTPTWETVGRMLLGVETDTRTF
jgi:indole-3-acetate monooxygenase